MKKKKKEQLFTVIDTFNNRKILGKHLNKSAVKTIILLDIVKKYTKANYLKGTNHPAVTGVNFHFEEYYDIRVES